MQGNTYGIFTKTPKKGGNMQVVLSERLNISKLSKYDRRMFKLRLSQLQNCNVLADMKYGRLHLLSNRLSGMYGLKVGRLSRMVLAPVCIDATLIDPNIKKPFYHYITGVKIYFSPNHYKALF